ncbi:MAG: hydrogenase expression/formation protein HypE [Verrucomicrobia bacterium]|nr:hydrogenase expression/formation protein HypE [Verrucomicrobiota bacterium]
MPTDFNLSCPIPIQDYPSIQLAHGGGGKLMQQLIDKLIAPAFKNPLLDQKHDGAVIDLGAHRIAFTTDSYVVHPLFFPGGDIGALAVNGTVNDLAMCGARARWLSCGLIIEEGLPMDTLWRVVQSMQKAVAIAGVQLVTGDTKVVDRGRGHGLFINTAGIGVVEHPITIAPGRVRPGDAVLISGDVGRHGMAIMSVREGLQFEAAIESDCAPLVAPVMALLEAGVEVHCLRDLTRGGLVSALNEIADVARVQVSVEENAIPVEEPVRGACEILGFDPLYVANEGRFVAFVAAGDAERALALLRAQPGGENAARIGSATAASTGLVTMKSRIGASRILDVLSGEQLPRIC